MVLPLLEYQQMLLVALKNNGKNTLYFCRAKVDGEYTPEKYYPPNKTCYIPWGGQEYIYKSNFQILFAN
ncbi:DM9 repeat-containing protein [Nostoc sp.]|uniref:DM9 repeat-containing protein n=1 Tax=Nostoc sp. TaxID=1180 RepID=UPI003FA54D32